MEEKIASARKELSEVQAKLFGCPEGAEKAALLRREAIAEEYIMVTCMHGENPASCCIMRLRLADPRGFLQTAKKDTLTAKVKNLNADLLDAQRAMLKAPKPDRVHWQKKCTELQARAADLLIFPRFLRSCVPVFRSD